MHARKEEHKHPIPTLSMFIVFPSGLSVFMSVVGVSVPVSKSLLKIEITSSQESSPTTQAFNMQTQEQRRGGGQKDVVVMCAETNYCRCES